MNLSAVQEIQEVQLKGLILPLKEGNRFESHREIIQKNKPNNKIKEFYARRVGGSVEYPQIEKKMQGSNSPKPQKENKFRAKSISPVDSPMIIKSIKSQNQTDKSIITRTLKINPKIEHAPSQLRVN